MNKQTRTIVVAGVLALVVAFLFQMTGSPPAQDVPQIDLPPIQETAAGQVVIARTLIPAYSEAPISERVLDEVSFPLGLQPAFAATNTSAVVNKIAIEDIYPNEIVSLKRVSDPDLVNTGIAELLRPGERAITIAASGLIAAGGFLEQGDLVDVVALYQDPASNDQFCRIILQGVRILVVGRELRRSLDRSQDGLIRSGGAGGIVNVTVASSSNQALRLQHLQNQVQYRMLLKNPKDLGEVETDGIRFAKLLEANLPERYAQTLISMNKKVTIDVIKGVTQAQQDIAVQTFGEPEL